MCRGISCFSGRRRDIRYMLWDASWRRAVLIRLTSVRLDRRCWLVCPGFCVPDEICDVDDPILKSRSDRWRNPLHHRGYRQPLSWCFYSGRRSVDRQADRRWPGRRASPSRRHARVFRGSLGEHGRAIRRVSLHVWPVVSVSGRRSVEVSSPRH